MHKQESSNLMPHDDILGRWRPQKTKQNYRLIVYDMLYECTINHHLSAIHIFPWNEISLKVICYRNSYSKNLCNSSDLLLILENFFQQNKLISIWTIINFYIIFFWTIISSRIFGFFGFLWFLEIFPTELLLECQLLSILKNLPIELLFHENYYTSFKSIKLQFALSNKMTNKPLILNWILKEFFFNRPSSKIR